MLLFGVSKTSYALFTSSTSGNNTLSVEVSSPGLIKLRIAKSNTSNTSSMEKYENKVYFNVDDGYVVDTYNCSSGEYSYDTINDVLTITDMESDTYCTVNYKEGYKKLYDIVRYGNVEQTYFTNSGNMVFYYKGNVDNNYVEFGNMLWRIMRTNEDKSIRLMLQDGINGNTKYSFNKNSRGFDYMYYSNTNIDGGIMNEVNNWYNQNLIEFDTQIVESEFCEAIHALFSGYTAGAASVVLTHRYTPSLKCFDDGNGHGLLKLKVGLVTMDEAGLAGVTYNDNDTSMRGKTIYSRNYVYWTMSPGGFGADSYANSFVIGSRFNVQYVNASVCAIIPVISISADSIVKSGDGTFASPYIIN